MECRGVNKDIIEGLRIKNLDLNMPSRKNMENRDEGVDS